VQLGHGHGRLDLRVARKVHYGVLHSSRVQELEQAQKLDIHAEHRGDLARLQSLAEETQGEAGQHFDRI